MNFSKDEVWDVITAPNYLNETHPFCKVNNVISWPGVGSKDTLEYLSGLTSKENLHIGMKTDMI